MVQVFERNAIRVIACLILVACGTWASLAFADETPGTTVTVRAQDRAATSEQCAFLGDEDTAYLDVAYTGLTPDTDYKLTITRRVYESPYSSYVGRKTIDVHTSPEGSGTWTIDLSEQYDFKTLSVRYGQAYRFFFETSLVSADNTDGPYATGVSPTAFQYGITVPQPSQSVVVNNTIWSGNYKPATIDAATAAAGAAVASDVDVLGLETNTTYKVTSQLVHITDDGQEPVGDAVVQEVQTPESWSAQSATYDKAYNVKIEVGTYNNLEVGQTYAVIHTLEPLDGAWSVSLQGTTTIEQLTVVEQDEIPEETPNYAVVHIQNYDENNQPLAGALLQVVSADNSTTVLDEWTATGDIHVAYLHAGDYLLVQKTPPDTYTLADPVPFTVDVESAYLSGKNFTCIRQKDEGGNNLYAVDVRESGSEDVQSVGFCFNRDRSWPTENDSWYARPLVYKENQGTDEALTDHVDFNALPTDELRENLARVMYNGYPNNASGIQEKYGLSDAAFARATQVAVWHYSDDIEFVSNHSIVYDVWDAYYELITTENIPEGPYELLLYIPNTANYQNVVVASFNASEPVNVAIANDKGNAQLVLKAKKILTGPETLVLRDGEFTFELLDHEGNVVRTATNDAQGNVVFEPALDLEPGEYQFSIKESTKGTTEHDGALFAGGVRYDTHTCAVTVSTEIDETYKLVGVATYADGADGARFENDYNREWIVYDGHDSHVETAPNEPTTSEETTSSEVTTSSEATTSEVTTSEVTTSEPTTPSKEPQKKVKVNQKKTSRTPAPASRIPNTADTLPAPMLAGFVLFSGLVALCARRCRKSLL